MVADTEPDLVITDIRLPTANGIDLAAQLVDDHPGLVVMILSAYDDEHYVRAALAAGVSGYLLKTLPSHDWSPAPGRLPGAGRLPSHPWAGVRRTRRKGRLVSR